ncbi:MAG TPA: hypothetical protein VHN98_11340 [Acidimicrobiales bacterium]|nr:hypothetical protein [Acidimicrobiales bacterium]
MDDGHDEFDGLRLDDDFVKGAPARELAAADRLRRAQADLIRLDEERDRIRRVKRAHHRANRPHRRLLRALRNAGGKKVVAVLVLIALAAAYLVYDTRASSTRRSTSSSSGPAPAAPPTTTAIDLLAADTPAVSNVGGSEPHPTPRPAENLQPLGRPAPAPTGSGPYQFMATQAGSAAPVTYDPCRAIPFVLNARTMPPKAAGLVDEAIAEISAITGLTFRAEGVTDEPPSEPRPAFQPDRFGDRWAPVLISWSDPGEAPTLAGGVAGFAGSRPYRDPASGTLVYVSGELVLDGPQLADVLRYREGRDVAKGVILHELAHLVGLHHVADEHELMNPAVVRGVHDFGNGDLHGLAQLGLGACIPKL